MPYFLNAPASMATNSGACSNDTAGTATLMILVGASAANAGLSAASRKIASEIRTVRGFIEAPGAVVQAPLTPSAAKCPAWNRTIADRPRLRSRAVVIQFLE